MWSRVTTAVEPVHAKHEKTFLDCLVEALQSPFESKSAISGDAISYSGFAALTMVRDLTLSPNVLILFLPIGKRMDMSRLKLDPALSSMPEPRFRVAVQDYFPRLFPPHCDSFEWDVAALYRSRDGEPTYYFSPGAPGPLRRFGEYLYEPCDRPDSSAVTLQIGSSLAVGTAWIELPDDTRPYPKLDQEFEDTEADFWVELMGSGGKHALNDGGRA